MSCSDLRLPNRKLMKVKILKKWKFAPTLDMFAETTQLINKRSRKRRSLRMTRLLLILKITRSLKQNCHHKLKTVVVMLRTKTLLRSKDSPKKRKKERRRKLKSKREKSLKRSVSSISLSSILKKTWKST